MLRAFASIILAVGLVAGPVLGTTAAYAGAPADAKCRAAKAKATGKKVADLLKALGKNISKSPDTKLAANISKAQSKFTKAFSKAESSGTCYTNGDVPFIEKIADDFVGLISGIIRCGNGVREPAQGETCDGGDGCPLGSACLPDCSGCVVCGNNVVEGLEECDGTSDANCQGLCQTNCRCPVPSCGNGVVEVGEECDTPCSTGGVCGAGEICGIDCQCVPAEPCNCGSPPPATFEHWSDLDFTGESCGGVKNAKGKTLIELDCGSVNIGGGDIGTETKQPPHTGAPSVYNVACCYGTKLALTATTVADTGTDRNCTSTNCFQGGPDPVVKQIQAIGTCVYNQFTRDAYGWADCATGEASLFNPIRSTIFITGDILKNRCAGGPNPGGACQTDADCAPGTCENDTTRCTGGSNDGGPCDLSADCAPGGICKGSTRTCSGGPNDGAACDPDVDCASGGICESAIELTQPCPICNPTTLLCNGGPNDGQACTLDTPDHGGEFPVSFDCPPPQDLLFGGTFQPHTFMTADSTQTEPDGQFCRFCEDLKVEESGCFEGDDGASCPDSATSACKPASGQIVACGTPTPCKTDSDCLWPYETCTQRSPGAQDFTTATTIFAIGDPAGDLTDHTAHAARLNSLTCMPPTFIPFQDSTADFPSTEIVMVTGTLQTKP